MAKAIPVAAPAVISTNPPASISNASLPLISNNAEWLKSFQVKRGFYLELAASDLLVTNPLAMTFDENGRLYVLEMPQNPAGNEAAAGRVRLLEDSDGNGVFDTSIVYADNLNNPSALICYDGGLFVAAAGQILYLKDAKGTGHADIRREVYKSFGDAANGQAGHVFISSLQWGLDNRIHAATASRGGDVISSSSPVQSLVLTNGNFSFDPRTFLLAGESGNGATGMCFDDRGRKFVSSPAQPVSQIMYESRYGGRNPVTQMPDAVLNLPGNAFAKQIYPSPLEPPAGNSLPQAIFPFSSSPVPFSAARSVTIYRGPAYAPEYLGDVFILDARAGVLHHVRLQPKGVTFMLERPADEQGYEFLMGRNHSFQPTQIVNAPDGALYLAGSWHEPTNSPSKTVHNRGRIYRILPDNFKQPVMPRLATANVERLVMMFRHPNGWYRDTAARLLYQRQDHTAIIPLIRLLFDPQSPPLARVYALRALDGIQLTAEGRPGKALMEAHVLKALTDLDDRVREQGILLAEKFISAHGEISDQLWGRLAMLASDPSPQVRYQLALTIGQIRHAGSASVLAQILQNDPDSPWMRAAVMNSFTDGAGEMFGILSADGNFGSHPLGEEFLGQLLLLIGEKNQPAEVAQALQDLQNLSDARLLFDLSSVFDDGLQRGNNSLIAADTGGIMKPVFSRAENIATDSSADNLTRMAAMRLLSASQSSYPSQIRNLSAQWRSLNLPVRRAALRFLLGMPDTKLTVLVALQDGFIPCGDLSSVQVRMLLSERDPALRQTALNFLGNGNPEARQPVVNRYLPVLQMTGDVTRGREIFVAECAACHRFGSLGNPLGTSLGERPKTAKPGLLVKILNPNFEVSPNPATVVETTRGERILGFAAGQSGAAVQLLDAGGTERDVARSAIHFQDSLGVSIMPEGMETIFNQQNLADLLEYLTANP